ncbi:uncharacterized protein LOC116347019 [Contarinia nasturtii]|uniref:uncharacterized protein LOC116347019 n=1 Tax=Contarinia nasturtii TaxID=265458 RepID=UPI0012D3950B|nr:uncharacterized protein LOC116347019 [Contarinia nasturtii]
MTLTGALILVINLVFVLCIGDLYAYELFRPMRAATGRGMSHVVPIRSLDQSTMRRLTRRPIEINPDSESIFLPSHQAKQRPLQIMERISVPVDANHNFPRKKKENFNVLNFEAYVMKPSMNEATIKPVTERILHLNYHNDDDRDDARPSPSSHHKYRSRPVPKKPKKSIHMSHAKEYDDLEFYRAFLEHQKHAAMVKRLKPKPEQNSRLPIGIDYFENKNKNKMFPPITYSPLYLSNLHRSHAYEDVEASNVQQVKMRHPDMMKKEVMTSMQQHQQHHQQHHHQHQLTTLIPDALSTMNMPMENEKQVTETMPPPEISISNEPDRFNSLASEPDRYLSLASEPDHFHGLASEPEMYKFTIDDVVVKPHAVGVVNNPFTGPVTLSPPPMQYQNTPNSNFMRQDRMPPAGPNTIHDKRFDSSLQTQLNYPPKMYARTGQRRFESTSFKNVPIETSVAESSPQQQVQKYSIDPIIMTTQMTFATDGEQNDAPVKAVHEIDSKRIENKRGKKRRLNGERPKPEYTRKVNHQNDYQNNLEFSSSYSKRRTQGYNSEEETATTPITPIKLKNNKTEPKQSETFTTDTPTKSEKVKYFQDTLTEQLTPHEIDTGHLSENPDGWEERYERKNLKSQRFQGKMKWGDRKGNFGEHYYDLNHHRNTKESNNTR